MPNLSNFKNFEEKDEPETPIKLQIQKQASTKDLEEKRKKFINYQKLETIIYDNLVVSGYNKNQTKFISKSNVFEGFLTTVVI